MKSGGVGAWFIMDCKDGKHETNWSKWSGTTSCTYDCRKIVETLNKASKLRSGQPISLAPELQVNLLQNLSTGHLALSLICLTSVPLTG